MTAAALTTMQSAKQPSPSAARAYGRTLATVGAALVGATLCGAATKSWSWEVVPAALVGVALAAAAVAVGTLFHARAQKGHKFDQDAHLAAQRMQAMLGGSFVAKLLFLGLGFGGLALAGMKFDHQVAFALAFAGAALSLQLGTVLRLQGRGARTSQNPTR